MIKVVVLASAGLMLAGCYSGGFAYSDVFFSEEVSGVRVSGVYEEDAWIGAPRTTVNAYNSNAFPVCIDVMGQPLVLLPSGESRVAAQFNSRRSVQWRLLNVNASGGCG